MSVEEKIRNGVLDCNNQELFFSSLIKGLLIDLNKHISIRNTPVPHIIINTGDEFMYLDVKGYDKSKEPKETTNEDYVYNIIPRCNVNPADVSIDEAQITSPYARGEFQIEDSDEVYTFSGEFRRMPVKLNVELKYYVDSFRDLLELMQQVVTKFVFIKTFNITYMGQVIKCSYKVPESMSAEKLMDIDGTLQDNRSRSISLSLEVATNVPVYNSKSVVSTEKMITNCQPPRLNNAYTIKI